MVTSAAAGEGKTSFCVSLARSLAASGTRVLVIDADLHRSRVGRQIEVAVIEGEHDLEQQLQQHPHRPDGGEQQEGRAFGVTGRDDAVLVGAIGRRMNPGEDS